MPTLFGKTMDIYRKIAETDGLVTDVDGVPYPVVPRIKFPTDFLSFFVKSVNRGSFRAPEVYFSLWMAKNGSRSRITNLANTGYHLVAKDKKRTDFESAGEQFCKSRVKPEFIGFLDTFAENGKPVVVCSRSPAARYILKPPHVTDYVSNELIFDKNGVFERVDMHMLDGKDKLKEVDSYLREKYSSCLGRFTYLGDADQDILCGREAAVFLASPYANGWCRKEATVIDDYSRFARRINDEMPKVKALQI
jgi:phosphoserine phosphatase